MTPHPRSRRLTPLCVAAAAALTILLASCSSTGGKPDDSNNGMSAGSADTPRATIAMVTHGAPGNAFWDLVRKGAETAAAKDNIELRYSSEPQAPDQVNLVQSAVDSKVDGIALTLAKPEAMAPAVKAAQDAGIPVTGLNAGYDAWKDLGVQQYFGQDETIAGRSAGERLTKEGARKVLCVIHEQGNISLESRCAGLAQTLQGGTSEILNVNSQDMPSIEAAMTAKLQQDSSIDHVVALDAAIALTAVQSKNTVGSVATVVTFDTNSELVNAIKDGDVAWAIDQQPFLQGYLAVDSLWLYLNNRNTIGGGEAVLTGPAFVDQSNVDAIAEYAANGTR
ncbi:substrate-binding domain-containing protein [Rhodococcus opacus]|uniref:substrate-binding domain-containing protein n=1 Tax=Rhodococcus opacus TaxID=37919 RepID=UPI002475D599|nr:substrate-binding domain-containing protein [Rhodococcus opacus]MDH6292837.1 simple sugar transport system substrate-binding protein [Rhodococcus opacus]